MKCLAVLTENPEFIDPDFVEMYLSQFISFKTILMNNSNEKSLLRNYLVILNHILHHTILIPDVKQTFYFHIYNLKY